MTGREAQSQIRLLEKLTRTARSEYEAACRELVRRDELEPAAEGDTQRASAAIRCANKKAAYDRANGKLRFARNDH